MKQQTNRQIKGFLTTLLLTTLLGGCSQEETPTAVERVPIRVNAVINNHGAVTRFTDYDEDATQTTLIYQNQVVWVWALTHTNNAQDYMSAWRLMANSSGVLIGSAKYYPDTGAAIDIVAVQGHFSQEITETNPETKFPYSGLTHSVMDNQSSQSAYASSDLLYARVDNRKGTDEGVVTLPFKHYLSRIEITLESTDYSTDDLKHATVEIVGVKKQVTISMNNGSANTEPTIALTDAEAGDILLKNGQKGNANGVSIKHDNTIDRDYLEGIVPPQLLTAGNAFIKVTLTSRNNRVLYYQVPAAGFNTDTGFTDEQKLTLMPNRRYQFTFTLFESNITLSGATYEDGFTDSPLDIKPEPES